MALHGLAEITIGVPRVDATRDFYTEFGLNETAPGVLATADGGDQLRIVERPYRQLVEYVVNAEHQDDVDRIRANAVKHGFDVTEHDDGSISVVEPVVGMRARVAIRGFITPEPYQSPIMNSPGHNVRGNGRAPAIFDAGQARPRRLGHVLYGTPDLQASTDFLIDVLGFELSDTSKGIIAFLRCSEDHHNVGLVISPVPFFHHSSWQVNDVDEIGKGAHNLLATDPDRSVWGLGRHFLGSNLFWYFRDPAGNYAEYYADLDQIPQAAEWEARDWAPDKSLYAWGPPTPKDFIEPRDIGEIEAALRGAS
ncbi:MAG: dioxygenase [Ilumatobacteraceae bacterium]|nr:dioxygenase [Ilumatobacteraceae bacterium]